MSTQTVRELAAELHTPVVELLAQLKEAGVPAADEAAAIQPGDKLALLSALRKRAVGGGSTLSAAAGNRITLKRTEKTEIKLGGGRGLPSKTVNVEVKKRRTYVAQDEVEITRPAVVEASGEAPVEVPAAPVAPDLNAQAAEEAALNEVSPKMRHKADSIKDDNLRYQFLLAAGSCLVRKKKMKKAADDK